MRKSSSRGGQTEHYREPITCGMLQSVFWLIYGRVDLSWISECVGQAMLKSGFAADLGEREGGGEAEVAEVAVLFARALAGHGPRLRLHQARLQPRRQRLVRAIVRQQALHAQRVQKHGLPVGGLPATHAPGRQFESKTDLWPLL